MELTLLTVPGCPSRVLFEQRLGEALDGRPAAITRREVSDPEQARLLGMHGSPTLLIGGADPFAAPGEAGSLSCRLYRQPDGSLAGAPAAGQLRAALSAAQPAEQRAADGAP